MFRYLYRSSIRPTLLPFTILHKRDIHSRNKKAMEFIAKGWSALQEVDRVIDYADFNDLRLIPHLRAAKENFELALEADNSNTHARYWLSRLHFKYHVPGACKVIGAALLVDAADMGDADSQYELACRLRAEDEAVHADQQAFYYLEKAVDQGHAGAAIAYGSLLLKGVEVPEKINKLGRRRGLPKRVMEKSEETCGESSVEQAKRQFQIAAKAGCDLGLQWLKRLEEREKSV
ncbi:uncharacterized protein LOC18428445 isoform X3 [Amborella trichopoda]|uniref:uncharacterized protein LOC18428445 isoform X3 n=1 Tax=Amborella trichopoda TaxID=13333 RepID=UPI0009C0D312|nr:uncharacterized protein LOC18428445 isoform X3 [Amborella trichopoda]|eukprot:XP_020519389.1 uncharacterized protein LOC18428445 isoform X3 [Amborella trichopoda]